jgi:hypothetical protein
MTSAHKQYRLHTFSQKLTCLWENIWRKVIQQHFFKFVSKYFANYKLFKINKIPWCHWAQMSQTCINKSLLTLSNNHYRWTQQQEPLFLALIPASVKHIMPSGGAISKWNSVGGRLQNYNLDHWTKIGQSQICDPDHLRVKSICFEAKFGAVNWIDQTFTFCFSFR